MTFPTRAALGGLLALAFAPLPAQAHFLLQHTPAALFDRPGDVPVKLVFWHPMAVGPAMDLERPREVFFVQRGLRTDLSDRLVETVFDGGGEAATAWDLTLPVKRSGDYVLVTVPEPYFEEAEDKYIQQIAKTVFNRNGLPTDWDAPVGLKTEILPLTKPYNVIAGSTFTGRVLADGAPVAGAEIEVEFVAAEPLMDGTGAAPATASAPPGGAIVVVSDADGEFTFGVPRAGWWGFAALDVGPDKEHDGKPLSQDAVLWIRAHGMDR
ncbi:DUF4198 domain-containing protein [Rhodovulum sp. DZ06]|uniref:DUF4198 domain-containing protein n=1 Tax=Rhodovulum sp. DZ06 TaxID=3425126 RepID=UPI003D32C515